MSARSSSAVTASVAIIVGVLGSALIALLLYGLLGRGDGDTLTDALRQGKAVPAPDFSLPVLTPGRLGPLLEASTGPALSDGELTLRELRGTPVVLNVWASWCGPCRDESPALRAVWAEAKRKDVLVLGLNQQDVRASAREFMAEERLTYPSVRDGSDKTSKRFGATGVPETFAIDRRGRIVAHRAGAIEAADGRALLRAAIGGRPG